MIHVFVKEGLVNREEQESSGGGREGKKEGGGRRGSREGGRERGGMEGRKELSTPNYSPSL